MITAAEQFLIELINRARLNPQGEADLYLGGNLNLNNSGSAFGTYARQPLAQNDALSLASANHSLHMINVDQFDHDGIGDGTPTSRSVAAGYVLSGSSGIGENISAQGTTGTLILENQIGSHHAGLFESIGHRRNILNDNYREIGIGQEAGVFSGFNTPGNFNSSLVTEKFGFTGSDYFLTGVVYNDTNNNNFYDIGEGVGSVGVAAAGIGASSASAGGYGINFGNTTGAQIVTSGNISVSVNFDARNIKIDFINGIEVASSEDITVLGGASIVRLLGSADLNAGGSALNETFYGTSGANTISGNGGNDTFFGNDGIDIILGGLGNDVLNGGGDSDYLRGDAGNDQIDGGEGIDVADFMTSTSGIDVELYNNLVVDDGLGGSDTIVNVERIFGSSHNDRILGSIYDDVLVGAEGNDILFGSYGNDYITGNAGIDYLIGSVGHDVFSFNVSDFAAGVFDTISDFSELADNYDFIAFTGGLQQSDLIIAEFEGTTYITTNALNFTGGISVLDSTVAEISDQLLFL